MRQTAVRCSSALRVRDIRDHLQNTLSPLWQQGTGTRLGLAVSGGVDSMALATLCRYLDAPKNTFHAFIVDHKVRRESSDEAKAVAEELDRLGIIPRILELDWQSSGVEMRPSRFERDARILRHRAIGQACRDAGISSLLLAHHADDQAETIMIRILAQKLGSGLGGMKPIAKIPECAGIWGVDAIHDPLSQHAEPIAGEGIKIWRPLLPYTKHHLVGTCRAAGTKWFEDRTNTDRSLTLRNTVRYITNMNVLPQALRPERLLETAKTISLVNEKIEAEVQRQSNSISIVLNLRWGSAYFSLEARRAGAGYTTNLTLIKHLLRLVSPQSRMPVQDLHNAHDYFFTAPDETSSNAQQHFSFVCVRRQAITSRPNAHKFILNRASPPAHKPSKDLALSSPSILDPDTNMLWSEYQLWDARYWIRVGLVEDQGQSQRATYIVRFLRPETLRVLRHSVSAADRQRLEDLFKGMPMDVMPTLPAVIAVHNHHEEVAALPTLKWCRDDYVRDGVVFNVKYKSVDLPKNGAYTIVDFDGVATTYSARREAEGINCKVHHPVLAKSIQTNASKGPSHKTETSLGNETD